MSARRVVLYITDLFFSTRVTEAARTLGVQLEAPPRDGLLEACRARRPDLVVIDLNAAADPIGLARELKADPALAAIPIVGFYPHVDDALRQSALAEGVEQVLPRSAFTARLGELLTGERRTPR